MRLSTWTTEQLLSLAPDQAMVSAGQSAAEAGKWSRLGHTPTGIWGEFANRGKPPQQTFLSLPNLAPSCNCFSRKFPCRHSLGLMLLFKEEPWQFNSNAQPGWLPAQHQRSEEKPDIQLQRQLYQKQLSKAQIVLEAYTLWLQDLIHSGLAILPKKPPSYWTNMAQRLTENGLYTLGKELRQLQSDAKIPRDYIPPTMSQTTHTGRPAVKKKESESQSSWPLEVLQQLGRHYLITQGFANYHNLSPAAQNDLRYAAGWFANPDDQPEQIIGDHWLIIGGRSQSQQKETLQQSWLWGQDTRRFVLLTRPIPREDPAFQPLIIGGTAEATLHLLPGGWPFRAQLARLHSFQRRESPLPQLTSIKEAQTAFSRALSANPWLNVFPIALSGLKIRRLDNRWTLYDQAGYSWPLPADFSYGWHLSALQEEKGIQIFGQWNGRFFTPLSFIDGAGPLPMHILSGIK